MVGQREEGRKATLPNLAQPQEAEQNLVVDFTLPLNYFRRSNKKYFYIFFDPQAVYLVYL